MSVVMPKKPKVVAITKSTGSEPPRTPGAHGVLRDELIVKIGPMVFAVNYAVRITELNMVTRDPSGSVIAMRKSVKPPGDTPDSPA